MPYLEFMFRDKGAPIDCRLYDVRLVVKDSADVVVINELIGRDGNTGPARWGSTENEGDESTGVGHYEWLDIDTHEVGNFKYEFKFERKSDGKDFSIPKSGFYGYEITEDIELPPVEG
jgi:hypothetical protein